MRVQYSNNWAVTFWLCKCLMFAKLLLLWFFKNRSSFTEHTKQNNKDLTLGLGGQFIPAKGGQGY
jgi:hypothetical protein